jgi:hypothetical protein
VRSVDIVSLVKLPLQPWQAYQHRQVFPHIAIAQLHSISYCVASPELCARYLASFNAEHARTLHAIEVLGKRPAICAQEVALHKQHEKCVDLIERVEYGQKVSWIAVRRDGEQVAERRGEERCELLFGEDLKEGGLEIVYAILERRKELHGGVDWGGMGWEERRI